MSVTSSINKVQYSGDGITSLFPFSYKIFATTDIVATIKNTNAAGGASIAGIAAQASVTLVNGTDYSVAPTTSLTLGPSAGSITILNALYTSLPVGLQLTIRRVLPKTQEINIVNGVATLAQTYVEAFDRAVCLIQELNEIVGRSLVFDPSVTTVPLLPALGPGALYTDGVTFAWQSLATTATTYGASFSFGADASKASSPGLGDVYIATDTFKIYKCVSGGVWTTRMAFSDQVSFDAAAINLAQATAALSAATVDLGAIGGNAVHITGTTTITALGTVQAGTPRWVVFDGILTLTHNATSLIIPGGANITTAAGDCALFISEGSGNWRVHYYQRASGLALVSFTPTADNALSGSIIGFGTSEVASVISCATTGTTVDDTVPAITDGVQILSLSYTPKRADSTLKFFVNGNAFCDSGANHSLALHKDGGAAKAATVFNIGNVPKDFSLGHSEVSGGVIAQTWTVRLNPSSGGNTSHINASAGSGTRFGGGVSSTKITVLEIRA